jgi:hypothetical protein
MANADLRKLVCGDANGGHQGSCQEQPEEIYGLLQTLKTIPGNTRLNTQYSTGMCMCALITIIIISTNLAVRGDTIMMMSTLYAKEWYFAKINKAYVYMFVADYLTLHNFYMNTNKTKTPS